MDREIVHIKAKTSWWDNSIIGLCGQRYKPGHYRETLFNWGATCPGCKAAEKAGRK